MENYQNFLTLELEAIKQEKNYDVNIIVATEVAYAKMQTFAPNTIYVVIKMLASNLTYNIKQQPLQIMVVSEQNRIDQTKDIMETFVTRNNWTSSIENGVYTKQQYNSPVVISNFNEIGYGTRSLIYVNGLLQIMEDIIDIEEFKIDTVEYKPLGLGIAYQMSGNTQALSNTKIAVTEKNMSTLSVTFTLPLTASSFTNNVLAIMNETESGNKEFNVSLKFNTNPATTIITTMKLISASIETAPNQAPSLKIGLMR